MNVDTIIFLDLTHCAEQIIKAQKIKTKTQRFQVVNPAAHL